MKAMVVWLQLMMLQKISPFPVAASSSVQGAGPSIHRRPGACWLFNESHCKFFGLCKFKHECSTCGGAHVAARCNKSTKPGGKQPAVDGKEPVSVDAMLPWLDLYPNRSDAAVLRNGFSYGFMIPFVFPPSPCFANNLKSARDRPECCCKKFRPKLI